ncbi:MAG: M20/M25/M40 family metallo-hydrolase [Planctomycetota bacterium]
MLRRIDGFDPEALTARLCRYVAIPSVSRQEGALADLVANELAEAGLEVRRAGNNVWCELGDAPRPRFLLNSHLDTVQPGQGWTGDPWRPRVLAEVRDAAPLDEKSSAARVVGLGANDAKGCVVALVEATLAAKRRIAAGERLGGTLVLALTVEEEISGAGLDTILPGLRPLDAAIVGEPTGLTPMIAQRGLLMLRLVARGRTSHPANTSPQTADNAIMAATRAIARLADFDWGLPHPVLGRCHAHVTRISGGSATNVIPDLCEFWLDIRTTPAEPHAQLVERLRAFLADSHGNDALELNVHSDRLVSVETPDSTPIVQAVIRALGGDVRPAGSPAMSDMVFLAGTPAVKIGPGDSARSHTPDEFITLDELTAGAAAYERIIREYFNRSGAP